MNQRPIGYGRERGGRTPQAPRLPKVPDVSEEVLETTIHGLPALTFELKNHLTKQPA
jgi:hypothetical protein